MRDWHYYETTCPEKKHKTTTLWKWIHLHIIYMKYISKKRKDKIEPNRKRSQNKKTHLIREIDLINKIAHSFMFSIFITPGLLHIDQLW
jgi:hypothetical protein